MKLISYDLIGENSKTRRSKTFEITEYIARNSSRYAKICNTTYYMNTNKTPDQIILDLKIQGTIDENDKIVVVNFDFDSQGQNHSVFNPIDAKFKS